MSNEKLGTEQGQGDASLEALAQALYDGAECNVLDDYKRIIAKWQAEQAYHARGAGREALTETELEILLAGRFGLGHDLVGNVEILWLTQQLNKLIAAHQGEPGADTGTTPSRDCVWTVEQNGAVHSVHYTYESAFKEEGENLRIGGPWQVLPWRAIERGTTPPEGLAFTFEEFIDMSLRHNKRLAAGISGIASFGHWYNEMLAATQRAPVEQGRLEERGNDE